MNFKDLDDVLTFAIRKEDDAHRLYTDLSERAKDPGAKKILQELASQELGHKGLLEDARRSHDVQKIGGQKEVSDLGLSQFLVTGEIGPDSSPQDILLFAIKMEEASHRLYSALLANYRGTAIEELLSRLADEERRHKEILERDYEKHFMQWM